MWVLREALSSKLPNQTAGALDNLERDWFSAMRNGTFNRKPYSEDTLLMRQRYLNRYWEMLDKPKSLSELNASNFKVVLSRFEHDSKKQNDHYGLKMAVYSAVVGFMKYLVQENLKTKQERDDIVVLRPQKRYTRKKQTLEHSEILKIIKTNKEWRAGRTIYNMRVIDLLLHLFTYAGIRRSEAITLRREDIDFNERVIKVFGKGSKERIIAPHPLIWVVLRQWFDDFCNDSDEGYLLLSKTGKPYDRGYLTKLFRTLSTRYGKHIHPHAFRGAYALIMANAGLPLNQLQYNMGHEDINTTMGYFKTNYKHVRDWISQNLEGNVSEPTVVRANEDTLLESLLGA